MKIEIGKIKVEVENGEELGEVLRALLERADHSELRGLLGLPTIFDGGAGEAEDPRPWNKRSDETLAEWSARMRAEGRLK